MQRLVTENDYKEINRKFTVRQQHAKTCHRELLQAINGNLSSDK